MALIFSSNTITLEINVGSVETPDWKEIIETTGIGGSTDGNIEEYDTYGDIFTKRQYTGGKKLDFSFETKLAAGDEVHEFIRDIAFADSVTAHNTKQIQLTFPIADPTNTAPRKEIYNGVIKPTVVGGQGATDLAVLNWDFMSSGAPLITKETTS